MERTKDRRGTAPVSACAERALIVAVPLDPLFTGVGHFGLFVISGGQILSGGFFLFPAHGGLLPSKFVGCLILLHAAYCLPSCLVRRWSLGRLIAAPTAKDEHGP